MGAVDVRKFARLFGAAWLAAGLIGAAGCGPSNPPRPSAAHLSAPGSEPEPLATAGPAPVVKPPPVVEEERPLQRYSVVVVEAEVKELLFALARDAGLNVDVHPGIEGRVTLHAVEQTLPRILDRIALQVALRYRVEGETLMVAPDTPFTRAYRVDYVNMSRVATGSVSVATRIATTGSGTPGSQGVSGGDNNSTTIVVNESANRFWESLEGGLRALLGEAGEVPSAVAVHRESGVVTVRAGEALHREVARYLDTVTASVARQVLIEATVVEVALNDEFQAGVDWRWLGGAAGEGVNLVQEFTGARLAAPPRLGIELDLGRRLNLTATLRALERFGELRVLSSPRLMVMNNQTAMLKVVDNHVYFTLEVNEEVNESGETVRRSFETTVHTVPVGFVMGVTPQIGEGGEVTLNVRPTISRVLRFVPDPSPALASAAVESLVPEIQVRELESVLRVASGRVAVLGGLMQEGVERDRDAPPGLSSLPLVGDLLGFRGRRVTKTELVIFLRPVVMDAAGRVS